jgi:hypothetical protein
MMIPGLRLSVVLTGLALAGALAAALAFRGRSDSVFAGSSQQPQEVADEPQCEPYCDPIRPGTTVFELRWIVAERPLGAQDMAASLAQQSVDVTVYSDGFERGFYATLPAVARGTAFLVKKPADMPPIPGLEKLIVTDVVTSSDQDKPDRMRLFSPALQRRAFVILRVEGVQSGLLYHWRVPSTAGPTIVACQGPICPVDYVRPPRQ